MDTLLHRFQESIKGVIEGFDRIVFKGMLKPICYSEGMQLFLSRHGVLNKNYKEWIMTQSGAIIKSAEDYSMNCCNSKIQYISSCHTRKEAMAHSQQKNAGIENGLIGVYSCVESCKTYKAVYDKKAGYPQIRCENSRCKHLYFYYDHEEYGFMSIRLQTWAPFEIQIALNGREWLRRQLDKAGIKYTLQGNKFLHIDNYAIAQELLDEQVNTTRWEKLLTSFLPDVFPSMDEIVRKEMSYTWILWQSEWARDYIFEDPSALKTHMDPLLRHAFITGTSDRVLRYMGRPVRADGQPWPTANPELMTRINKWYDGARIRHWVDRNSIKLYNEQNVLRFEMTMNDPTKFRIHRTIEGKESEEKKLLPMRKGIADIYVRSRVSTDRVRSFTEHMSTVTESVTTGELISGVSKSVTSQGKRFRALEVTGKDLAFLQAVADPRFSVDAITNKHLRGVLEGNTWANGLKDKKLSARISRHLRLLREHGLIKKLPRQHKYMLTDKGRLLTTALNQVLAASIDDLAKIAA